MSEQIGSRSEGGMVTSEYAIGTMGTCGLACVLVTLLPMFDGFLRNILEGALNPILPGLMW